MLIKPGTSEGYRLKSCWSAADRPERFFVPYTFVEICESRRMLLKQIFIHENRPMGIHIHPSIANVTVRGNIAATIMVRGLRSISWMELIESTINSIPAATQTLQRGRRGSSLPITRHPYSCSWSRSTRASLENT